jgi:chromosome segregation ATPase
MPFQNVILPEVTVSEMRGLMTLLHLIAHPQHAETAAELLTKLSAEKDAAVEAAKQAASDRIAAEKAAATVQAHHADLEDRLARTEADLRKRVDIHARAAAKLQEREDDLRVKQTQHASAVAAHQKEVEAARTSHDVRDAALTEREQQLADAHADIGRRTAEFNSHMAPVLAAAALARI